MRSWVIALVLLAGHIIVDSVHARPGFTDTAPPLPDIEEMLTRAGWTITPEMSAKFSRPGDILDGTNTTIIDGADCFDAEVKEGAFAKMEVTQSMAAGVRLRVKVVGVGGGVGLEKKIIFDTPIYRQISRFNLAPAKQCSAFILAEQRRGVDTSTWHVITESLSAVIQQQQCGEYNAKAGTFLVSADASINQACAQTSLEPVAVAYKTLPITELTLETESDGMRTAPSQAVSTADFGSVGTGMNVSALLREQQCDEQAKTEGAQARIERIAAAEAVVLAKAKAAWDSLEPELRMCTKLKRSQRDGCIAAANQWLGLGRMMQVTIEAGVESVQTDCGARQSAYEANTRTVAAADVARAEGLLAELLRDRLAIGEADKYYYGDGVMIDFSRAAPLYEQACADGEQLGCAHLSRILFSGLGMVPEDKPRAARLMQTALPALVQACEGNELVACRMLGLAYDSGNGVKEDDMKAVHLFRKACEGGDASGCNHLGWMYDDGRGVTEDDKRAASLYRKACDSGLARGCANLGWMYDDGRGVTEDDKRAASLYRKACDGGYASGCSNLGAMYANGNGVTMDYNHAASLYRKACDAGVVSGCSNLGAMHANGNGVTQSDKRAAALFRKACDGGEASGCFNLGMMYASGFGVTEDDEYATSLFRKACDGGVALGCRKLGID